MLWNNGLRCGVFTMRREFLSSENNKNCLVSIRHSYSTNVMQNLEEKLPFWCSHPPRLRYFFASFHFFQIFGKTVCTRIHFEGLLLISKIQLQQSKRNMIWGLFFYPNHTKTKLSSPDWLRSLACLCTHKRFEFCK